MCQTEVKQIPAKVLEAAKMLERCGDMELAILLAYMSTQTDIAADMMSESPAEGRSWDGNDAFGMATGYMDDMLSNQELKAHFDEYGLKDMFKIKTEYKAVSPLT